MGSGQSADQFHQARRGFREFRDPFALTIPDDEHSVSEIRWTTLGKDVRGQYVLVVHTFEQSDEKTARVRIVSACSPTRNEIREYEEGN